MRAVVQRVSESKVSVDGEIVGAIDHGLMVLVGSGTGDTEKDATYLARKIVGLRVFEDDKGAMNRDLLEVGGKILAVSQFTLYGDCRKGRRPSFIGAQEPEEANRLYEFFVETCRSLGATVQTGRFRTTMSVELCNQGPVTLLLDSRKSF
jgi:D-aminoacyl-tRNA deacylase